MAKSNAIFPKPSDLYAAQQAISRALYVFPEGAKAHTLAVCAGLTIVQACEALFRMPEVKMQANGLWVSA